MAINMTIVVLVAFFAEIAILVKLGQVIGGGLLFLEIVASAAIGYLLLRKAGRTVVRTGELIAVMANPAEYMRRKGWPLILAGLLLIVPGILSDVLGLALFARVLLAGAPPRAADTQAHKPSANPDAIDVEYEIHDDDTSDA